MSYDDPYGVRVGQESYIGLDDADQFAAGRLFCSAWNDQDTVVKSAALRTATAMLDGLVWSGRPLLATQPLAWPRVPDACPRGYPLEVAIPIEIANACVELAIHLLTLGRPTGAPVQSRMLGDSMTMYFPTIADDLPKHVRRLIEQHLRVSSANVAEVQL